MLLSMGQAVIGRDVTDYYSYESNAHSHMKAVQTIAEVRNAIETMPELAHLRMEFSAHGIDKMRLSNNYTTWLLIVHADLPTFHVQERISDSEYASIFKSIIEYANAVTNGAAAADPVFLRIVTKVRPSFETWFEMHSHTYHGEVNQVDGSMTKILLGTLKRLIMTDRRCAHIRMLLIKHKIDIDCMFRIVGAEIIAHVDLHRLLISITEGFAYDGQLKLLNDDEYALVFNVLSRYIMLRANDDACLKSPDPSQLD